MNTTMRKILFFCLGIIAAASLQSCNNNIDLYAKYKDITVVYGLLDASQDTNYIKINKAFLGPGNALVIAKIEDSCNYDYKLDAKLIEKRNGVVTKTIALDTITIYNKKPGTFYNPKQLVYYTKEKLNAQRSYELNIQKNDNSNLITSTTGLVGGDNFMILTSSVNFSSTASNGSVKWHKADNAAMYEVIFRFHYIETLPGQEPTNECFEWSLGTYSESTLILDNLDNYTIGYSPEAFFPQLKEHLGENATALNVTRTFGDKDFEICIAAGGNELYNFIQANAPSGSIAQGMTEYTNISNGYGVFSSRYKIEKVGVKMNALTVIELEKKGWGFKKI